MNGSWHLGRIAGIDVRIHWTFLLLPIWIYFSSLVAGSGAAAATVSVLFVLAIFGCVVLHELGHALTARQFGIPTRDITLLPIGGVARLERMPRNPWQELAIAIAGPAVNVVIAIAIFSGLLLYSISNPVFGSFASFMARLGLVNVALVIFNMLPAFPMDGGRVLRAILALRLPYAKATQVAANVGQVVAAGLALLGMFSGNIMLVFVAGFVFLAARSEAYVVGRESGMQPSDNPVDTVDRWSPDARSPIASSHELPIVSAQQAASSALGRLQGKAIDEFLVSDHGSVVGVVRLQDLRDAVVSGHGTWMIERLLAMRFLPFRGIRSA